MNTVLAPVGRLPAAAEDVDPAVVAAFTRHARRVLDAADNASLLVGHLAARHRVTTQVYDLAVAGNLPVAVLSTAKGSFPESDPRFAGLYAGPASAKRARLAVEDTDVLITAGVTLADTVLGGAHQLPRGRRIDLAPEQASVDGTVYPGLGLRQSLGALAAAILPRPTRADLAALPAAEAAVYSARDQRLTQSSLWALARALDAAGYHTSTGRPALIEAVLAADDAPPLLQDLTRVLAAAHG